MTQAIPDTYRALRVLKDDQGARAELQTLPLSALPEGDVLIRVTHSSLNYKDGLAITNAAGLGSAVGSTANTKVTCPATKSAITAPPPL